MKSSTGFPKIEKIVEKGQILKQEASSNVENLSSQNKHQSRYEHLANFGLSGPSDDFGRENIDKILAMTPEEVKKEQQDILSLFDPETLKMLKNLGRKNKQPKSNGQQKP